MNRINLSEKLLSQFLSFQSHRYLKSPPFAPPFFNLKIAGILSDRLYQCIGLESVLFLLTPENYKYVFRYGKIDLFLIESTIQSKIEWWKFAQMAFGEAHDILLDSIALAKKLSIPVIFWKTNSELSSPAMDCVIRECDIIYQASTKDKLISGRKPDFLAEAIQPRFFHPLAHLAEKREKKYIIIDGISNVARYHENIEILNRIEESDLLIIDSNNIHLTNSSGIDIFSKNMMGYVNNKSRIDLLKQANVFLSLLGSRKSDSLKRWQELEVMAMGVPVLFWGALDKDDIRKNLVLEFNDPDKLLQEMICLKDPFYNLRISHKLFRHIHSQHTIAHRIKKICGDLNINSEWDEYPLVTICFATYRKENLLNCIDQYARQIYPNKELIIVYNGTGDISKEKEIIQSQNSNNNQIRFISTPQESGLGAALNCGIHNAKGDFFFKMDDDDFYSEHYIYDMIVKFRCFNFQLFGKPQNNFFRFEGEKDIYQRENQRGENYFCKMNDKNINGHQIIIGNSIAGQTDFFKQNLFIENSHRHTDSMFFYNLSEEEVWTAVSDPFNMLVERRNDLSSHTWMVDKEEITAKCGCCFNTHNAFI